jgi:hypothetical protein
LHREMRDDDARDVLCAGQVVRTPAWQKLLGGHAVQVEPSREVCPSGQAMDASETDGSKQKSSRHARIRVWARVEVIYGIKGTEYLAEGVLGAGGAHACGLVVVV